MANYPCDPYIPVNNYPCDTGYPPYGAYGPDCGPPCDPACGPGPWDCQPCYGNVAPYYKPRGIIKDSFAWERVNFNQTDSGPVSYQQVVSVGICKSSTICLFNQSGAALTIEVDPRLTGCRVCKIEFKITWRYIDTGVLTQVFQEVDPVYPNCNKSITKVIDRPASVPVEAIGELSIKYTI